MASSLLYFLGWLLGVIHARTSSTVDHSIINENVLFYKDGEMSLSSSRWILTLVLDINVYDNFITQLTADIKNAKNVTEWISKHYSHTNMAGYLSVFRSLQDEVITLEEMNNDIKQSFLNLKTLKNRPKRAILEILSGVLGFIFGNSVSSSDLNNIRANINVLAQNQQIISHALEKSLSVLNVTQSAVRQNRQSINEIIDNLGDIRKELNHIVEQLGKEVFELQQFVHLFAKVNMVIAEIRTAIQKSFYYFLNLKMQINALSMRKLTPNIINPQEFKLVLKDIETQLPKSFGLPVDVDVELWSLYKNLVCQTIMEDNRILIVIPIPLIDYTKQMDIYKVYNLPLPISTVYNTNNVTKNEILTYYDLEAKYMAINPERTQFMLLDQKDREKCRVGFSKLCTLRKPIHQTNLANKCLVAVFNDDKIKMKRLCSTLVALGDDLPEIQYLSDDTYIIITRTPLTLNLACDDTVRQKIEISVPYGFIRVRKGCVATSNKVTLAGSYEHGSSHKIHNDALDMLKSYNFSNLKIWEPFKVKMPNLRGVVRLPQKLKDLKEVPLDQFFEGLSNLGHIRPAVNKPFPWWGYCLITFGIVTLVSMSILVYCKWGRVLAGCLPTARGNGGGRGARASCLYRSDPDKGPDSWSNRDDRKTCTIYKGDNGDPQEILQQSNALLEKEVVTRLSKQGDVGKVSRFLPLQPTNITPTIQEQ